MAQYLISENVLTDIADAIRGKLGTPNTSYKPVNMKTAINSIPVAGAITYEDKTVTPNTSTQQVEASTGKTLRSVTVNPIPSNYVIPTGTTNISANGTYNVKNYATATIAVSGGGGGTSINNQSLTVTPSESSQSFTAASPYTGYSPVTVNAITATYVGTGVTRQAATTYTPGTSNQTIAANKYLTGAQTIKGDANLVAGNIKKDVTIFGVTGTYEASGGSNAMNIQAYHGMHVIKVASYTATNVKLTVAKTGTYKVSWMGFRNTNSGTNGSQLYINGTAYGTAVTTFTNTYGQSVVLTGVSLNQGDEVVVRARARSTSYYMGVGNLVIEQTA